MLLGVDLRDAKEEVFVRMVCDGIALGVAFVRAGFKGTPQAAHKLFHLPRIQERANAILEARRTQGVVTLSEVTDMLQRVFAGAHAAEEYSAAHNAAFSLARLYGHVTDKATLEVIRRPSRDPDAPSEQVLGDWVASLPVVSPALDPLEGPPRSAPAALLGPGPSRLADLFQGSSPETLSADKGPEGSSPEGSGPQLDLFNDINGLSYARQRAMHVDVHRVPHVNVDTPGLEGRAGTENGAPVGPVTGAPNPRAHSGLLKQVPVKIREKPVPVKIRKKAVPVKIREKAVPVKIRKKLTKVKIQAQRDRKPAAGGLKIPSAKALFG